MKKKLLIVDDQKIFRAKLIKDLSDSDYYDQFEVIEAVDGLDAVEKFKQHDIDVMTVDLNMPNLNGFEFLDKVKNDCPEKFQHTLKFIVTAEWGDQAQKFIMNKYLVKSIIIKPINFEKFLSAVLKHFDRKSSKQQSSINDVEEFLSKNRVALEV